MASKMAGKVKAARPVVAYSYIRFSSKEQAGGNSLERQTELAAAYCERRGWMLNAATYRDLGVSAFKGKNALVGNLGEFLKAVEARAVKPGSALIVESLDRITRQGIDEGYDLIKRILKAGIVLVTLTPEREFDVSATKSLSKGALEIQLILERAAEESEMKSTRIAAAWRAKQASARQTRSVVTAAVPAWIEVVGRRRQGKYMVGGKHRLIPERAAVVKRIFKLAAAHYGCGQIVKKLTEDNVPAFYDDGKRGWHKSYVGEVLRDRRVLGEYQPRKGRQPDGKPIPGYYPAAVTKKMWLAAQAKLTERRKKRGRIGNHVNLFAGLLRNALDTSRLSAEDAGDTYIAATRQSNKKGKRPGEMNRLLVTTAYSHGRGSALSFPLDTFEWAILSELREVDPSEVTDSKEQDAPLVLDVLEGKLAEVQARTEKLKAELLDGDDIPAIADTLRTLRDRETRLEEEIAAARTKAANPITSAWKTTKSLLDTLATAPDPRNARLRLRAAIYRIVQSIWMIVVPRGRDRLCYAQVRFADGDSYRSYLIIHRVPRGNQNFVTPGRWWTGSMKQPEGYELGLPFNMDDLRNADDVEAVKGYLESLPADVIERLLRAGHVID